MTGVTLLGSTGMVGNEILAQLIASDTISKITTLTRRPPKQSSEKLNSIIATDPESWYDNTKPFASSSYAISAFGTTRADAGGLENFKKIDFGYNLKFAQTAKANGVSTFVLISSQGANSKASLPYLKIKGQLEDEILKLDFDHTVILKPGMLLGHREKPRLLESIFVKLVGLPGIRSWLTSNSAENVAKKAVELLTTQEKVKTVVGNDINI